MCWPLHCIIVVYVGQKVVGNTRNYSLLTKPQQNTRLFHVTPSQKLINHLFFLPPTSVQYKKKSLWLLHKIADNHAYPMHYSGCNRFGPPDFAGWVGLLLLPCKTTTNEPQTRPPLLSLVVVVFSLNLKSYLKNENLMGSFVSILIILIHYPQIHFSLNLRGIIMCIYWKQF